MARGDRPTTRVREADVERERRERARRERERRRATSRPEQTERPERAERRPERPARAGGGAAVRERHEGLVGWIVRNVLGAPRAIGALPDLLVRIVRGFALEVVAVVTGIGRVLLSVVPGASRIANRKRIVVERTVVDRGQRPRSTGDDAAARPRRVRIDARRRARLRLQLRVAAVALLVGGLVAAWVVVPSSDAFRIRHLEVTGASAVGDLEVRERIDSLLAGKTVFTVDEQAVARRIEELPFVRDVRVERHLPGGLQLHVREYRPLALGFADGKYWLLARDGRVLAKASRKEWTGRIPVVTLQDERIEAGDRVGDEPALRLLASRVAGTRLSFETIEVEGEAIFATIAVGDETIDVRFGRDTALRQKLMAAELMLAYATRKDIQLRYIDVTVPGKPAFCSRSVVACGMARGPEDADDAAPEAAAADAATTSQPLTDGADQLAADDPVA